jgi:YHS domain-containing protein
MIMRYIAKFCIITWLALAALAGQAQSRWQSPNDGPWRTSSDGADTRLMLEGHDAVAYFTQNEAIKGDPAIKLEFKGVTWRFASEANKAEFQKTPDKYMPQFGGFCSNGINYAVPWGGGGGPNTWRCGYPLQTHYFPRAALQNRQAIARRIRKQAGRQDLAHHARCGADCACAVVLSKQRGRRPNRT